MPAAVTDGRFPREPGAEKLGAGAANMWVLPSDLTAARLARLRIDEVSPGLHPDKVNVARLLVTELVANAVQHGSGVVVLLVVRDGDSLRVHVEDESSGMPVVVEPRQPWPEDGAGMRLIVALADSWGVEPRADGQPGKSVWFTLE